MKVVELTFKVNSTKRGKPICDINYHPKLKPNLSHPKLNYRKRNFHEFRELEGDWRKLISHNTELKPTRESLSTRNFQILLFVKVYPVKMFSLI